MQLWKSYTVMERTNQANQSFQNQRYLGQDLVEGNWYLTSLNLVSL